MSAYIPNFCTSRQQTLLSILFSFKLNFKRNNLSTFVGTDRTIGNIAKNYEMWCVNERKVKTTAVTMKYKCCTNLPIFEINQTKKIIDICVPPQLHLMLGVTNRIYKDLEAKHPTITEIFIAKIGLSKMKQFGFNGKACRKIMKNFVCLYNLFENDNSNDQLGGKKLSSDCDFSDNSDEQESEASEDSASATMRSHSSYVKYNEYPHVLAFKELSTLVEVCFGMEFQPEKVEVSVRNFEAAWTNLGLKNTTKSHIIFKHMVSFIDERKSSLGFYSEQSSESLHHDFNIFWEKFKVDVANNMYSQNLLRAVLAYNSGHV